MRVLHVIPSLALTDGGPPWVVAGLADATAALGVSVTVAALGVHQGALQDFDERVEVILFQHMRRGPLQREWGLADWLGSEARRFDVLHAHSVYTTTTHQALDAARFAHRSAVLTPHGALMTGAVRPWEVWKRVWVVARLRHGPPSPPLLHTLSQLELRRSAWANLRGVVHAPLWRLRPASAITTAPRDGDYIIALGRVHPIKRLELLLRALASVADLRLVVAGCGDRAYVAGLQRLGRRLGVAGRVEWCGRVSGDVKAGLLRGARCLVQASRLESFGVAVLEALANGVPAAAGANVAAAEWVRSAEAGLVVGEDVGEWVAALRSVASESERWRRFAANAAQWSQTLPTRAQQGTELCSLYRGLLP